MTRGRLGGKPVGALLAALALSVAACGGEDGSSGNAASSSSAANCDKHRGLRVSDLIDPLPEGMELAAPGARLARIAKKTQAALASNMTSSDTKVLGPRSEPDGTGILIISLQEPGDLEELRSGAQEGLREDQELRDLRIADQPGILAGDARSGFVGEALLQDNCVVVVLFTATESELRRTAELMREPR